jgi:hypothetical protein
MPLDGVAEHLSDIAILKKAEEAPSKTPFTNPWS